MQYYSQPVLLLALAMILAIGIERLLELLRVIVDFYEARWGKINKWNSKAQKLRNRIENRLDSAKGSSNNVFQSVLLAACRYLVPPTKATNGMIAISSGQLRSKTRNLQFKLLGILLGIVLASFFCIDVFDLVNQTIHKKGDAPIINLPKSLGIALSGIAMGLGAGPVHKLIIALESARKSRR